MSKKYLVGGKKEKQLQKEFLKNNQPLNFVEEYKNISTVIKHSIKLLNNYYVRNDIRIEASILLTDCNATPSVDDMQKENDTTSKEKEYKTLIELNEYIKRNYLHDATDLFNRC